MSDEDVEQDFADPEWQASMARAEADVRAGRVLPASVALLPLPWWAFWLLYLIAPYTWGRKYRKLVAPAPVTGDDRP